MKRIQSILIFVEHVADWNEIVESELFLGWLGHITVAGHKSYQTDSLASDGSC